MRKDLARWQWSLYPDAHTRRLTLALHVMSVPLFISGTAMLAVSPILGWHFAVAGVAFMLSTVAIQGWTHKQEPTRPVPFDGPLDFVRRFFVEQWITFPRFVLSGKWLAAWRRDH